MLNVTGKKGSGVLDPNAIGFFYESGPFKLSAADSNVYSFQVTDNANEIETYKIKITIYEQTETAAGITQSVYDTKTFFLNVG